VRTVSKEEFYEPIFRDRLNVHPRIVTDKWPYTSVFIWPSQPHKEAYGKVVGLANGGSEYYIATRPTPME